MNTEAETLRLTACSPLTPLQKILQHGNPMESSRLFVALSKFAVANGMTADVKAAFLARPHLVDAADGFVRLDVLSPIESPDEIWLITYWRDENSFRAWHKSHTYRDSHKGIPKGLKLNPDATEIRFFEHVAS